MKKNLPDKMFYSITEVAQYFEIPEHTLRYWESEFDILSPKRSKSGRKIRSYTTKDIQNIERIYHLLRDKGLTIAGAKEQLRRNPQAIDKRVDIKRRLIEIKTELQAIRNELVGDANTLSPNENIKDKNLFS